MKKEKKAASGKPKKKSRVKKYILRSLLILVTLILMLITAVVAAVATVAYGPSKSIREGLVLSATQASATKWVPGLFLSDEEVADILERGSAVNEEVVSFEDYKNTYTDEGVHGSAGTEQGSLGSSGEQEDEWAHDEDGIKLSTFYGSNFKAYMLLVRDPSRLYVACSGGFGNPEGRGKDIFGIASQEGCIAAVNGGEFPDGQGIGTGSQPIGLTYSRGRVAWNQQTSKSFIGIDKNNKLVVLNDITPARAQQLGIRDGVSFQPTASENVLITNDGEKITIHRHDGDKARAQRTAIGQRADGAIILLVTDGRTAASAGATYNDITEIMVKHGAVTAGMLDGGSSSVMYYDKFYEKYPDRYPEDELDRLQKRGLVNRYVAFASPRTIPTFFCVAPER